MKNYLEELVTKMQAENFIVEVDTNDGYAVRVTADSIGDKEEGLVLLEINKIDIDELEDYSFYHFFSMLVVNIDESLYSKVLDRLNDLNKETLIGSYGLIKEDGIIYHKYVAKLANDDDESKIVNYLFSSLENVLAVIDNDYNKATEY